MPDKAKVIWIVYHCNIDKMTNQICWGHRIHLDLEDVELTEDLRGGGGDLMGPKLSIGIMPDKVTVIRIVYFCTTK